LLCGFAMESADAVIAAQGAQQEEKQREERKEEDKQPEAAPAAGQEDAIGAAAEIALPEYYVKTKKKYAIMLGYSGIGYLGLQVNGDSPTIERELEQAICKTGVVKKENFGDLKKSSWTRAARTDKGVHAVGQVVALKVGLKEDPVMQQKFVDDLNKELPDQIRVFDVVRTTKGFNSKNQCSGRKYEYLLPTFLFRPRPFEDYDKVRASLFPSGSAEQDDKAQEFATYAHFRDELCKGFTITDEMFDRFNACLQKYVGSRRFHNFTPKIAHNDPAAQRYIVSIVLDRPFLVDGLEVMRVNIEGQSFMLHQIRKMIGTALETARRGLDPSVLDDFLTKEEMPTPMVPGEGLALRACLYQQYNLRYGDVNTALSSKKWGVTQHYPSIDFERANVVEKADAFRMKILYPTMIKQEREKNVFTKYIWFQDQNAFPPPAKAAKRSYDDYKEELKESKRKYLDEKLQRRKDFEDEDIARAKRLKVQEEIHAFLNRA